jgi:hypothetical protein
MIMKNCDVINPLNDDLIDQIVDGALTPARLRAAIDLLDREPDGWKRCTLAFLETQCWRESCRLVGEPKQLNLSAGSTRLGQDDVHPIRTGRRWGSRVLAASVVAASFAFGWLGHQTHSRPRLGETVLARSGDSEFRAETPSIPESLPTTVGEAFRPTRLASMNPREEVTTVARLRVGSANAQTALPILTGPGINTEWLKNQPPAVSEHGLVVLLQHGYQVDQRRRLVSATLADGRRVTVPIDQVQIRYMGNNPL